MAKHKNGEKVEGKSKRTTTVLTPRPSREEAEAAVRTLLRWAGDDPNREGLLDTPARVVRAYEEFFAGYQLDPREILARTFSEVDGYDEMIVLKDIRFESYCEHHMVPIIGRAHVAYLPEHRVVGISKLARLVDAFAKRLQIQEKMTVQIADTFSEVDGYDEMIVLKDIRFESYCEHHMVPIIGRAHVAYLPEHRVVGISKLARLVDAFAKRLQIQEKMTVQIADTLFEVLQPKGVGVILEASHQCISTRGIHKPGVAMVTSRMLGAFRTDQATRREFLSIVSSPDTGLLPNT